MKDFLNRRPQRLCKMCGKCCRVAVSSVPHDELLKKAKDGNESAIEFLEIFEPYNSVEDAMKVDEKTVKNIPEYESRTFYKCKYILDNNLCSRYKERGDVCKNFPSSPWAVTPPGCGFEGWLFQEREAHKQHIRKLKEEAIYYKTMLKTDISEKDKELYNKLIEKINNWINLYSKYNSQDW